MRVPAMISATLLIAVSAPAFARTDCIPSQTDPTRFVLTGTPDQTIPNLINSAGNTRADREQLLRQLIALLETAPSAGAPGVNYASDLVYAVRNASVELKLLAAAALAQADLYWNGQGSNPTFARVVQQATYCAPPVLRDAYNTTVTPRYGTDETTRSQTVGNFISFGLSNIGGGGPVSPN